MKRFILILLLSAIGMSTSFAQSKMQASNNGTSSTGTNYTDDTVSSGLKYWYYKTTGYTPVTTVGVYVTKISGTPGGYVILEKSLDGTNYELNTATSADSFLITNVSTVQTKTWDVGDSKHVYYRLKQVPTGTMSTKAHALILLRK